jgi:hypothetical protein
VAKFVRVKGADSKHHIKNTKSFSEKQCLYLLEDGVGYKTAEKYLPFTTFIVPRKQHKCSVMEEGQLVQEEVLRKNKEETHVRFLAHPYINMVLMETNIWRKVILNLKV